ncbi:MAG: hypothetical protein MJ092_01760 [Lachnospiraceae bacterium]|nr:hypothetical protein [Lachnospiraceae bacterium]
MHDLSSHTHEHFHETITAFDSPQQAIAIITYMLEHNKSHAEELHEICHKLEASGQSEAAFLIDDAVGSFRDGNALLELALNNLKKAEEEK